MRNQLLGIFVLVRTLQPGHGGSYQHTHVGRGRSTSTPEAKRHKTQSRGMEAMKSSSQQTQQATLTNRTDRELYEPKVALNAHVCTSKGCGVLVLSPEFLLLLLNISHQPSFRSGIHVCSLCKRRGIHVCAVCARERNTCVCSLCRKRGIHVCSLCRRKGIYVCSLCRRRGNNQHQ